MNKIQTNKSLLNILMFLLLGVMYTYLLSLNPKLIQNGMYWVTSFMKLLVFYYFVFILATVFQIVVVILLKVFPLKVISIYPFTYDGKWRCHPIRLIYNTEGFNNSLIINLSLYVKDTSVLLQKMKIFLIIRKVSFFISFMMMFLFFHEYTIRTAVLFILLAIGISSVSYFKYGDFWIGYDYLYSGGAETVINFLYGTKSIMLFTASDYAKRYIDYGGNDDINHLAIFENYLYRCVLEKNTMIPIHIIIEQQRKFRNLEKILSFNLYFDTKWLNVLKLIGLVGMITKEQTYVSYSLDVLTEIYTDMVTESSPIFVKYGSKKFRSEIDFIKSETNINGIKQGSIELLDIQNIFSIYDDVFK